MSIVNKPWGYYEDHMRSRYCVFKTLYVRPGQRLSVQKHNFRDEIWLVEFGSAEYMLGDEIKQAKQGDVITIKAGQIHALRNTGLFDLVVREMQTGLCSEDDIVRLEDLYGRADK